ncbi:hypothetical protein F4V43_01870 [Paenibacillus spiritus]|uniref:Uncharacterized protein n=1 Tax=Paenibacillus spiritus TaxID=2496557 RepID=A0A5J5GHS7_9BACL|nr:hypothetical protein [Paenibacillus spiritus]KAA9007258.1 hypothetical protein F4V43_01870 [Paenibacillus spiritus]
MDNEHLEESDLDIGGSQFGVRFTKRGREIDRHVVINIYSEDDECWFEIDSFSSYWIDDLINVLTQTKLKLETEFKKAKDGFGYEF